MAISTVDWDAAQTAVVAAAPRVAALVRAVTHPDAPALGTWSVADVAIHLSHALDGITGMAKGGGGLLDSVWNLGDLTTALVGAEEERDLGHIADRIEASAGRLLAEMRAAEDTGRSWLVKGIEVPMSTLTCHALNELTVHGYDIARADGQPWPIPRADAALVLSGFVFHALGHLGRAMVVEEAARGVRATYDVQLRGGGGRVTMRFDDGDFSVTPGPPTGRVDCHLSVDPVAFLLVAWGRISQWQAIPKGQLMAWGRKPWLGLKLRTMLKNP